MLVLEDKKKPISSRDGMKLCVETSTTFDDWVRQSEKDYQDMLVYLKENDFAKGWGINGEKMPWLCTLRPKQHHQPFLI